MAQGKDPVTRANGGEYPKAGGGHERSHQIEAEIDRTRAAMDRTVDAIAGKLTPQQLAFEALGVFKDGSSALATRIVQTAREHPVPATIIGIGIGLLLTEKTRGTSTSRAYDLDEDRSVGFGRPTARYETGTVSSVAAGVKDTVAHGAGEAREKVGDAAAAVKEQAVQAKDQVAETAGHLKDQVKEKTEQVRESADHLAEQVKDGAGRIREQAAQVPARARQTWHDAQLGFWQTMEKNPFAIGVAALAVGVAAGLAVPSSRKEQELMGETRDRLLDQAKGYGREAVDMGRQVARVAGSAVKSEVERQGLTPATLVEKVKSVGREAGEAAKQEAERVAPEPLRAVAQQAGLGNPGGAAGQGMSAGFASTGSSAVGSTPEADATLPGGPGSTFPK